MFTRRSILKSLFAVPFAPLLAKIKPAAPEPTPIYDLHQFAIDPAAPGGGVAIFNQYAVAYLTAGGPVQFGQSVSLDDSGCVVATRNPTPFIALESAEKGQEVKTVISHTRTQTLVVPDRRA